MIEANENIDLVTMRRQQDVQRAQEAYRKAVSEGRLAVQPRTAERGQLEVAPSAPTSAAARGDARPPSQLPLSGTAEVATSATAPAPDPEAAWRYTRLAITAGLVVLLFVVWIWQKRTGR